LLVSFQIFELCLLIKGFFSYIYVIILCCVLCTGHKHTTRFLIVYFYMHFLLVSAKVTVFFFVVLYVCPQENRIISVYHTLQFTVHFQSLLVVMDFRNEIF